MSSDSTMPRGGIDQMAYCHECAIEIRPLMTPDPTCPRCNGSFVEILPQDAALHPHNDIPELGGAGGVGGGINWASLVSSLLTGIADAQRPQSNPASPRSPTSQQGSHSPPPQPQPQPHGSNNYQRRSGNTSFGPFGVQWNVQYGSGGSDPYQHLSRQSPRPNQQGTPFPTLSNFLQQVGNPAHAATHREAHSSETEDFHRLPVEQQADLREAFGDDVADGHHDDGMGGAGGAADGRHFNHDNHRGGFYHQPPPSQNAGHASSGTELPPQLDGLRNLFAGLFGGEATGGGTVLDFLASGSTGSRGQWGDYVVGQQGLDDIISQIMEQTQGSSGPPPAADAEIKQLERFTLSDKTRVHKAKNQECPTCKDDFFPDTTQSQDEQETDEAQQQELVSMPCGHIFHVDCLVPWLRMHGTCPVCRVSIVKSSETDPASDTPHTADRNIDVNTTNATPDGWPAPPSAFTSLFGQTGNRSDSPFVPGSFPTTSMNATDGYTTLDSRHFHPFPTTSTTVTSTVYTSPALSPSVSGVGRAAASGNQVQVVNSIVSSPPLVSDGDGYFSGEGDPPQDEIRNRSRRAAESRLSEQHAHQSQNRTPWGDHYLEPDELD